MLMSRVFSLAKFNKINMLMYCLCLCPILVRTGLYGRFDFITSTFLFRFLSFLFTLRSYGDHLASRFKGVNNMIFIQLVAEVPAGKLVEAHGTFSTASCIRCQKSYDGEQIKVQF